MDINCYLAMTPAEIAGASRLPEHVAYMSCHFSSYSSGLSNLPAGLPPGSMVILNDLIPPSEHDPDLIARQMNALVQQLSASCVLLDLQRHELPQNHRIAAALVRALPCPVGVTPLYAKELDCPVFLPPAPLHTPLKAYLQPWSGRDIWLEAATQSQRIKITGEGSEVFPHTDEALPQPSFAAQSLHCRYHIDIHVDHAIFTLSRTTQELHLLLEEAHTLGVGQAVGLYQQLRHFP